MEYYGIKSIANDWFASHLSERRQFVSLFDTNSDYQLKLFFDPSLNWKASYVNWVNPFSESSPSPSHVRVRVRVFLSAEIIYTFLWFNIKKANTKCFHRSRLYLNVSFWRGSLFLLIPPITTESPVQLLQPDYQALGKYRD